MKTNNLINGINSVISTFGTDNIKLTIGDSINNHRVLTVSQLIRFLGTRRKPQYVNLGKALVVAYSANRGGVIAARSLNGLVRTDAVDINELIDFLQGNYAGGGLAA